MPISPDLDTFLELAKQYSVVPVSVEVLADRDTPVTVFEKLVGDAPGFLLESVEGGENWAQWSFVGWDPQFTLRSRDGAATVDDDSIALASGDPLTVLEDLIDRYRTPDIDALPPLHSGVVGYMAYDTVRYIEHLPDMPPDDRGLPEMVWQFVGALAAIDRFSQSIVMIRNVFVGDDPAAQYHAATAALSDDLDHLGQSDSYALREFSGGTDQLEVTSTFDRAGFVSAVEAAKAHIVAGDAFQVVLSQRLDTDFSGNPFDLYRALRVVNPSPFLFYINDEEVTVVGASPEVMTRVRDGVVYSRPIAGTRPRGKTEDEDRALAEELLADPKERAEHVMLIDLARNDVGRVAEFASVNVDDLMVVERYSHVMHIVSEVSGKLRAGNSAIDVIRATFPHGTVSGAPKVRAMEIIDELEPVARGPYAGAVGYFDFSGNVDTCICLRTIVLRDGTAWVQAGAGLVADSDPELEFEESMDKARAALTAIQAAKGLR